MKSVGLREWKWHTPIHTHSSHMHITHFMQWRIFAHIIRFSFFQFFFSLTSGWEEKKRKKKKRVSYVSWVEEWTFRAWQMFSILCMPCVDKRQHNTQSTICDFQVSKNMPFNSWHATNKSNSLQHFPFFFFHFFCFCFSLGYNRKISGRKTGKNPLGRPFSNDRHDLCGKCVKSRMTDGVASFYRIPCYHFMFSTRSAKQLNQCFESFVKKFIGINTIITN